MTYQSTVQGYTVTSNVPFNQKPASGTRYSINYNFTNNISAALDNFAMSVENFFSPTFFKQQIESSTNSTITSPVMTVNGSTLNMQFTASSPYVLDVVGAVLVAFPLLIAFLASVGLASAPLSLGLSLGLIALGAFLLWLGFGGLQSIETTLSNALGGSGGLSGWLASDVQTLIEYIALGAIAVFGFLLLFTYVFKRVS